MSEDRRPTSGNPFNVLRDKNPLKVAAETASMWENARVDFTLGRLKLGERKHDLYEQARTANRAGVLSFAMFNQMFPTFPVTLSCNNLGHLPQPLHRMPQCVLPQWFKTFRAMPFVASYEEVFESLGREAQSKPVGMVFPRLGLQQGLVIHNGPFDQFVGDKMSCFLYTGGGIRKQHEVLVVQPYFSFLDRIHKGLGWTPSDS